MLDKFQKSKEKKVILKKKKKINSKIKRKDQVFTLFNPYRES